MINSYVQHLERFMAQYQLFPQTGRARVAVSGGLDSMALLALLLELRKKNKIPYLHVFHFNHQSRPGENESEALLVEDFCKKNFLPFEIGKNNAKKKGGNWENLWRKQRYDFLTQGLEPGDLLYTAHHIDDSFEWMLMNQLKSSGPNRPYGIPLKAGSTARPLHCFTRRQLEIFAKKINLPYCSDSSNLMINYERNYIRQKIIPLIALRFPHYLKHYVRQAQDWSVSRTPLQRKKKIYCLVDAHAEDAVLQVQQAIESLSLKGRGRLRDECIKLVLAARRGKWGPMNFSGGVSGFAFGRKIILCNQRGLEFFRQQDQNLADLIQSAQGQVLDSLYLLSPPDKQITWAVSPERWPERFLSSWKKIHPLLPESSQLLLQKGLWFRPLDDLLMRRKSFSSRAPLTLFSINL